MVHEPKCLCSILDLEYEVNFFLPSKQYFFGMRVTPLLDKSLLFRDSGGQSSFFDRAQFFGFAERAQNRLYAFCRES